MSASTGTGASTTVSKKNRRRHHHSSVYDDMDHASAECVRLNLDVARFACLFIPPDSPAVSAVSFAQNLTARLERHLEQTLVDADDEYFGSLSMLSSSKMSRCGLDHTKSHRHIHLLCDGHAAYKIRPSLYRTTRSRCPVLSISAMSANRHTTMQQQQRWSYFEVVVAVDSEFVISSSSSSFSRQDDDEQGRNPCGVCVGLSTKDLASDRLVGSDDYSVGLHCSGRIVRKGGTFYPACCKPFGVGDHIGCAVYADGSGDVGVAFFVNRVLVTRVTLPQQQEQKELFASISLYKPGVKVVLLCCKEDWDMKNDAVAEALGMQPSSYCSF